MAPGSRSAAGVAGPGSVEGTARPGSRPSRARPSTGGVPSARFTTYGNSPAPSVTAASSGPIGATPRKPCRPGTKEMRRPGSPPKPPARRRARGWAAKGPTPSRQRRRCRAARQGVQQLGPDEPAEGHGAGLRRGAVPQHAPAAGEKRARRDDAAFARQAGPVAAAEDRLLRGIGRAQHRVGRRRLQRQAEPRQDARHQVDREQLRPRQRLPEPGRGHRQNMVISLKFVPSR